jgi:hypothetical protein
MRITKILALVRDCVVVGGIGLPLFSHPVFGYTLRVHFADCQPCSCALPTIPSSFFLTALSDASKPFFGLPRVRAPRRLPPFFATRTRSTAAHCTTRLCIKPQKHWMLSASPSCVLIFVALGGAPGHMIAGWASKATFKRPSTSWSRNFPPYPCFWRVSVSAVGWDSAWAAPIPGSLILSAWVFP